MSSTNVNSSARSANPRGIPYAPFVANVEEHLKEVNGSTETALREFQEALASVLPRSLLIYGANIYCGSLSMDGLDSKYKYMEQNLSQRKRGLEEKIPDIEKTLSMVQYLGDRRKRKAGETTTEDPEDVEDDELVTTFELNDTLYAQATLEDTDTVHLWLGANVMLSYTIPECIDLLTSKLTLAQTNLENAVADLLFLREQITIMEVNLARVYNWDVRRRRNLGVVSAEEGEPEVK